MKAENITSSQGISKDILFNIESMGGVFNIQEASSKLDVSIEQVNQDIEEGRLIAFEEDGELKIPSFQIKNFKKIDHLETVLENMKNKTFENKIDFLTRPQKSLSDRTPFYILKKQTSKNEIEKVIELSNK